MTWQYSDDCLTTDDLFICYKTRWEMTTKNKWYKSVIVLFLKFFNVISIKDCVALCFHGSPGLKNLTKALLNKSLFETSPWPIYMKHHYPRKTHGTLKGPFFRHRKMNNGNLCVVTSITKRRLDLQFLRVMVIKFAKTEYKITIKVWV